MEKIRTRFRVFFMFFMIIFVVATFGGLGIGFFYNPGRSGQPANTTGGYRSLVPGITSVAEIGGKKIPSDQFWPRFREIESALNRSGNREDNNPFTSLETMNLVLEQMFREEVLSRYARENRIGVTDAEVNQKIEEIINQLAGIEDENDPEKSVVAEVTRRIRTYGEKQRILNDYLERNNLSKAQLTETIKRELLVSKANDSIQKLEQDKGDKVAKEKLEKIEAELKAGKEFAEVAREHSDDPSSEQGGLLDFWFPRNFLDPSVAEVAFKLKVGEYSEPIKQEFGYELVQIVDKKEAVGKEFEKERENVIKRLKERNKGITDYEPTEEDIKKEYEQVKIRRIVVKNPYQSKAFTRIEWLIESYPKVIYDPQILAYRAYNQETLHFPEVKDQTLTQIASQAKGVDAENLNVLPELVKNYSYEDWGKKRKSYGEPPEDLLPALEKLGYSAEPMEDKENNRSKLDEAKMLKENKGEKPGVEAEEGKEEVPVVPAYPLAIGLLMEAMKTNRGVANINYFAAYLYDEWIDDQKAREIFPLDVDTARAEIERLLLEAIDKFEFQPHYYALLAKNYALWVKPEEARKQADLALKYGGNDEKVLGTVRTVYIEIGDKEKAQEIATRISEIQSEKEKERAGRSSVPIQIPSK